MRSELEVLVEAGKFDEALLIAATLAPARVRELLSWDSMDDEQSGDKYAQFIVRYFYSCASPYLRSEIARCFAGAFILELVATQGSYATLAELDTVSLQGLVTEMALKIDQGEDVWVAGPYVPLPKPTYRRWKSYADQLRTMHFQPTLDEGREHEKASIAAMTAINDIWDVSPRQQWRRDEGRSIYDAAGDPPESGTW